MCGVAKNPKRYEGDETEPVERVIHREYGEGGREGGSVQKSL